MLENPEAVVFTICFEGEFVVRNFPNEDGAYSELPVNVHRHLSEKDKIRIEDSIITIDSIEDLRLIGDIKFSKHDSIERYGVFIPA